MLEDYAAAGIDFAFETTLAGTGSTSRPKRWKANGYWIILIYIALDNVELSISRVAERVKKGGHNIPESDIRRRFARGRRNFEEIYRPLADQWILVNNTSGSAVIEDGSNNE